MQCHPGHPIVGVLRVHALETPRKLQELRISLDCSGFAMPSGSEGKLHDPKRSNEAGRHYAVPHNELRCWNSLLSGHPEKETL